MGKLSDLWGQLKTCKEEDRELIQKKINDIEKWMIENGYGNIKEITDWKSKKKTYRFEDSRMGNYGQPALSYIGRDRCGACRYNNHTWCDRGITKPCMVKA